MKNSKALVLIIILATVAGAGFLITQEKQSKNEDINSLNKNLSSRYVEYTTDILNKYADKKRVLFFYANWCPICKPADEDFKNNGDKIPADVVVIRVNYNDSDTDQEEKDLAKKYGITYQHTFVQIDSSGNEAAKWNGGKITELLENLK